MKIVELHNHVLFQVDDGATSIEQSKWMIEDALNNNVDILVCTPHYNEKYKQIKKDCEERLSLLQSHFKNKINLYLGLEIMLSDNVPQLLAQKSIWSINNSRYLLVEFPMDEVNDNAEDILSQILEQGYIPIIAHPERHHELYNKKKFIKKLVDMGCLFQLNAGSLLGKHGKFAKNNAQEMLQEGLYSAISSDAHDTLRRKFRSNDVKPLIDEAIWTKLHQDMFAIINDETVSKVNYQPKIPLLKKIFGKY